MDNPFPVVLSICCGIGMLDHAVELVFPGSRVACFAEWESYAAAILLARMEDEAMEPAPVWCGDLADFDATPFLGVVDILTAGLPCQPYSLAGKREGNSDHRVFGDGAGPLPKRSRIISECRPSLVFLENVPAWVRSGGGFDNSETNFAGLGYEILEPLFLSAGDVGASHERERVFILATRQRDSEANDGESRRRIMGSEKERKHAREAHGNGDELCGAWQSRSGRRRTRPTAAARCARRTSLRRERPTKASGKWAWRMSRRCGQRRRATDRRSESNRTNRPKRANGICRNKWRSGRVRRRGIGKRTRAHQAAAARLRPAGEVRVTTNFRARTKQPRMGSTSSETSRTSRRRLNPAFDCWLMGMPMVVDASRQDQLRCVGNGVVALQAALALALLLKSAYIVYEYGIIDKGWRLQIALLNQARRHWSADLRLSRAGSSRTSSIALIVRA